MAAIDRTRAREAFRAYVEPYDITRQRVQLKADHTYHVARIACRIASEEGFPPEEVDLAWLCGLLHDIGRFEQLRRWDTFDDTRSASHAELGVDVLFENGAHLGDSALARAPELPSARDEEGAFLAHIQGKGSIRCFLDDDAEDARIRAAVAHHSGFRLPTSLDDRTRALCHIVRDADKIDILRTVCASPVETVLGISETELMHSPVSPEAMEAFYHHRTLRRDERTYPADYLVGLASFAFELVYPASMRIAVEQGHIYEPFEKPFGIARPFDFMAARDDLRRLDLHLHAWIDQQVSQKP